MGMCRVEQGSDVIYGLALISVSRMDLSSAEYLEEVERLLSSIDGHAGVRMVLQARVDPSSLAPQSGEISIHLLLVGDRSRAEAIEALIEDIEDLLSVPPKVWAFRVIEHEAELLDVVESGDANHLAEVVRRQAPCPSSGQFPPVGYNADSRDGNVPDLWSVWRFDPTGRADASIVLLSQDAPIVIRTVVTSTELSPEERRFLEEAIETTGFESAVGGIRAASGRVVERMLVGSPLYDARVLVASPSPIGTAVLTAIGWSISPPQDRNTQGLLSGGFEILQGPADAADRWRNFDLGPRLADVKALGFESSRIRRLLTMTEAATALGLPMPSKRPRPGMHSIRNSAVYPPIAELPAEGSLIGHVVVGSAKHGVRIRAEDRMRHLFTTGQTGTGKSTLLGNLILDDITRGAGVAVIDPHGSLVQAILERIPDDRVDDVIVIEPADTEAVVGVNLLEAETDVQKTFIVSELVSMFYALFDPGHTGIVGPRYETWLRQAAHLLLATPQMPSSFLDIPTLYTDSAVQKALIKDIDDVVLAEFWRGEQRKTSDYHKSEVLGWFRSKFEPFRLSTSVRRIVGQAESTVSFDDALRDSRIILVNLSKGHLGSYNANLIGFIVMTRLWQATLGRAASPNRDHPEFYFYVDEFQNLTTNSLAEMLSEARKFGVGVTLANQFLGQIQQDVRSAIMGNVSTKLAFRLGPEDAQLLAGWMGAALDAEDLTHLPNHKAIASLSNMGRPLDPVIVDTLPLRGDADQAKAEQVRRRSREQWATPVDEIDEAFRSRWAGIEGSFAYTVANPVEPVEDRPDYSSFLEQLRE